MTAAFGALIAAGIGAAVVLLLAAVRGGLTTPVAPGRLQELRRRVLSPTGSARLAAATVCAVLTLVVTAWPVAALAAAALVVGWPRLFGGARAERRRVAELEALVMWTEALRDTVTARASLEQAIPATAVHAAPPIRPALVRLVGRLRARVPLDTALLGLAAELDDASADKVIGALVLNSRRRGTGLASVLGALAASGRAELDSRRRISAGRASMRRSVQLVVVITVGFAGFLATFSRDYVAPYRSVAGQFALAVVVALFAMGFLWLRRLAAGEPARPFLNRPVGNRSAEDLRLVHTLMAVRPDQPPERATGDVAEPVR